VGPKTGLDVVAKKSQSLPGNEPRLVVGCHAAEKYKYTEANNLQNQYCISKASVYCRRRSSNEMKLWQ
jgi:hypothetical protein